MLYQKTIRQFIALVMLVVFAFSITPQKSVHDLVAKHADPTKCSVHKDAPIAQVENSSIHCAYDNLVVASPFINFFISIQVGSIAPIKCVNTVFANFIIDSVPSFLETRGPPAIFG
ncbi:MAG: hypothetical protein WCP61_06560 [Chitinophagia bacterium]